MKKFIALLFMVAFVLTISTGAFASTDKVISRWRKTVKVDDEDNVSYVQITATYYSAEYIKAVIQDEAQKNLWTKDEEENYKYELLKSLRLEEYIPVFLEFENYGSAMRMAPFSDMAVLWINNKKYSPTDYDKRFNFKLRGKREGFVYFPRYNEKTGKSLLKKAKTVRLSLSPAISPMTMGRSGIDFYWDVKKDNPAQFFTGKAAERLEADRLITRLGNLKKDRDAIQSQLDALDEELVKIQARIDEIQTH